jgi:hypothetical protein
LRKITTALRKKYSGNSSLRTDSSIGYWQKMWQSKMQIKEVKKKNL